MDAQRLAEVTGRSIDEWVQLLDGLECRELDHTATARLVPDQLPDTVENKGWWAQSVTVEYEKAIGRRVVGQTCEGDFQVSVSKTWHGTREEALDAWVQVTSPMAEFGGVAVEQEPTRTQTEKWSRWRAQLADGSRVVAEAYDRPRPDMTKPARAAFAVTHQKLASTHEVERWRAVWKSLIGQMG
ncbi:hypothetical protein ACTQ49_11035 [Luteococcus sp. Sow4_B9]|uniref:hypothetical protein n=1 Tax=Luteococcus sp. Sow4_B9 TaxID=3438792 RepID=UPI003F94980B